MAKTASSTAAPSKDLFLRFPFSRPLKYMESKASEKSQLRFLPRQGLLEIRGLIGCFPRTEGKLPLSLASRFALPFLSYGCSPRSHAMSRGFDGLEIDDFHGPERDVNRSPESNSAGWDAVRRLERIRGEEERADQRDQEARGTSGGNRPPLPREERVQLVLARTSRTNYVHRNRPYQLRDSELHALTEVGKFRVVAVRDLAQFAYNDDSSRMHNDLANLSRQGLVKQTSIMDSDLSPIRAVTLTKEGHRALSHSRFLRPDQAAYHGLKKPKEAFHDAELHRLYHKVSDEIEGRGGKVVRVKLDYEIKRDLYADLARTWQDKSKCPETLKEAVARRHGLRVVNKEIQIPDMRLEYANDPDMEIHTRDVELATEHYRPRGLAAKARAGFQIYARRGEADRLRRIRDERELNAVIFSL